MSKSDTYWFVSPVEREAFKRLEAENKRLWEALQEISKLHVTEYTETAYETTDDEAVRIARATLGDTDHE